MPRRSKSSLTGYSLVLLAKRRPRPAQDLFGGLHRTSQMIGDRDDAEPVDVTQHQRRPIGGIETSQHDRRETRIDRRRFLSPAGMLRRPGKRQIAIVSCLCTPMIDEL